MDILFISNVLPFPLDAGPKVRSYYVLRYLALHHRVTLVTHTRAGDTDASVEHLRSFCHAVHCVPIVRSRLQDGAHLAAALVRRRPFLIVRDDLASMRAALGRVTSQKTFDAIHADQLSTAHYALAEPSARRILDQHNAVWTIVQRLAQNETFAPKRLLLERETRLLQQHEAAMNQAFDRVITVTTQDRLALDLNVTPRSPILTIPICIDPDAIQPIARLPRAQNIACVGGMFYPPNADGILWFARNVLPIIWQAHPQTKFFVIGARPARELLQLGENDARILVTGYVPDTTSLLQETAAFVVPLRAGGGMRVKILDAWARALPLVTTTIGCEGISVRDGENALIADSPGDFAAAVNSLLRDRARSEQIARNGRNWVEANYNWRATYRAFDAIYPN
jgi:polysaccharide biosynthesis protein PslH